MPHNIICIYKIDIKCVFLIAVCVKTFLYLRPTVSREHSNARILYSAGPTGLHGPLNETDGTCQTENRNAELFDVVKEIFPLIGLKVFVDRSRLKSDRLDLEDATKRLMNIQFRSQQHDTGHLRNQSYIAPPHGTDCGESIK